MPDTNERTGLQDTVGHALPLCSECAHYRRDWVMRGIWVFLGGWLWNLGTFARADHFDRCYRPQLFQKALASMGRYSRLTGRRPPRAYGFAEIERDYEPPVGCGLWATYWERRR